MSAKDKIFEIPFVGLKLGKHSYEFEINDTFFELFEYGIVQKGLLKASLELEKKETMMIAVYKVEGTVETACDRCNAGMRFPISGKYQLIYKFGLEESEDETLIVLHPDEFQFSVKDPIYELITVSLPNRIVHPKGECDPEMLELMNKYTLNAHEEETEESDESDEDWDDEDWDDDDFDEEDDDQDDDEDEEDTWSLLKNLN